MLPTKNSLAVIEEDVSMVVGISTLRPIGCMRNPTLIVCDDCNRVPSLEETINCCGIVTIGVNAEYTKKPGTERGLFRVFFATRGVLGYTLICVFC